MTSLVSAGETVKPLFPVVKELPDRPEAPGPLVMFDGTAVKTRDDWFQRRRPELLALFRYYMYGFAPPAPGFAPMAPVTAKIEREDRNYFGGKATKREVTLTVGPRNAPPETPKIELLLIIPNRRSGPVPTLVALNWAGNHAVVNDPAIPVTRRWMYHGRPGESGGHAGEAARGWEKDYWCAEYLVERGYALATFYNGDICPDPAEGGPMMAEGIQRYFKPGQTDRGPHDWGSIGAWAWGMSRVVDYLWTMPETFDRTRFCAFGHSRHGKTALWAAAQDERFAIAMPHQSGAGGCVWWRQSPWGRVSGFGWFAPTFAEFQAPFNSLPVDQHLLVALVAPRAVLVTEGEADRGGGEPASALSVVRAADPVYKFLGLKGLPEDTEPVSPAGGKPGQIGNLMYYCRPATDHTLDRAFWETILDRVDGYWTYRATKTTSGARGLGNDGR